MAEFSYVDIFCSNFILVAHPSATSEGMLYPSYSGFFRTGVPSSQYKYARTSLVTSESDHLCFCYLIGILLPNELLGSTWTHYVGSTAQKEVHLVCLRLRRIV